MKKIFLSSAILLTFLSGSFAEQEPQTLHIGPYLQNVTQNSIVIMWETTTKSVGSVEYGHSAGNLNFTATETESKKLHEIKLTGLETGTVYFYRCVWGNEKTQIWRFKTVPSPAAEKVKIITYGDSRSNPEMHRKIAELVAKEAPDFVLHSGDIVGDGRKRELWKPQFFDPIKPYASEIPLYPVLGNHERNAVYYYAFYSLNNNEAWWSMDYGPVHIIGLDSNQPGEVGTEQYQWLKQDLEAHKDAKWKIAMFHHPLFNAHHDRPIYEYRWSWHPLFQEFGVDLVINGHDHYYARTLPIGQAAQEQHGVTYIISAGGGAPLYPTATKEYIAYRRTIFHFTALEFDGDQMIGRAVDTQGRIFDSFVINKQASVSPEEFISFEMMQLRYKVEEEISSIVLNELDGKLQLSGTLTLPTPFRIPVVANFNWKAPKAWHIPNPEINQQLVPGDTLVIKIEGTVNESEKYPLPNLHIEITGDNERWTPPNPPLGFRNTGFSINIEDALFNAAMRSSGKLSNNAVGLRFIKDFPGSRYTPQILGNFWQFYSQSLYGQKQLLSDLKQAKAKIHQDSKKVLFSPPMFLLGDFSGWSTWLEISQKADHALGKAMAPNLLALLRKGKIKGGLIKNWYIVGPFDNTNDEGYYRCYEPENHIDLNVAYNGANGQSIRWQKTSPNKGEYLDFTQIFAENEEGVVYAFVKVQSEKGVVAPLLLGSNDAAIVWVNGVQVYRLHQHRSAKPGDDLIIAHLRKGVNTILVKIDQVGGGWGLYLHILDKDGVLSY